MDGRIFNVVSDAYHPIREKGRPEAKPSALATFEDGYQYDMLVDAMLKSHAAGEHLAKGEIILPTELTKTLTSRVRHKHEGG